MSRLRPCIDIHNGKVKQIIGSSLRDEGESAAENFVAGESAASYASLFRRHDLRGGHVILLNKEGSPHYEETKAAAKEALAAWPGGLMAGGGITADNAAMWIDAGASHVIVTSYVFSGGQIREDALRRISEAVGREHLVIDLSSRQKEAGGAYYIMTDRWQHYTDTPLDEALMEKLSGFASEFLVHGIAVEGKGSGIDSGLVELLSAFAKTRHFPVTYAGGIRSLADIREIETVSGGCVDYTVGSALDIYGGNLPLASLV